MKQKIFTFFTFIFCFAMLSITIYNSLSFIKNDKDENVFNKNYYEVDEGKYESPDDWLEYEFDMLKNPVTGKIPAGIKEKEVAAAK